MATLDNLLANPAVAPLRATDEGRIWLANLAVDLDSGNLPAAAGEALLAAAAELNAPAGATDAFPLADDARAVLLTDLLAVVAADPGRFLRRSGRHPRPQALARVMDAESFGLFHLHADLGLVVDDRLGERVSRQLGVSILPEHYTGQMRTAQPWFWAAPAADLPAGASADEARALLGLGHYPRGCWLVAMEIPADRVATATLTAPTTLDAGGSPWFAPHPGHELDRWGRTCDLRTRGEGLREALVTALPMDDRVSVRALGCTQQDPPADLGPWVEAAEARAASDSP